MALDANSLTALQTELPNLRLLTAESQLAAYDCDALSYKHFRPDAVAIPASAKELVSLVKVLDQLRLPWVVRGAGTSLSGGPVAVQGGVVVHLSQLKAILEIDVENQYAVVESGAVLANIAAAVKAKGLYYPPDASSGSVCTIGGNVACNSGGVHCFRYGVTSDYILGLEVVLPNGQVQQFGGPAGGRGNWKEDWKRLFVGSEGTLGVFTRFWLKLIPPPEKVWTFRAMFPDIATVSEAITKLSPDASYPSAIELMDPRTVDMVENSPMAVGIPSGSFMLLAEIDGPPSLVDTRVEGIEQCLKQAGATEVLVASDEQERQKLWRARKVQGGLLGQASPDFIVQDAVIPKAALADVLQYIYQQADQLGLPAATVMHAGDGNLHPNFLFNSAREGDIEKVELLGKKLMQKVSEVGGTLSGEHGLGNDKAAYFEAHCGEVSYAMQQVVPRLTNSAHQLNPQKVMPERVFQ